jgi:hypothetical protein
VSHRRLLYYVAATFELCQFGTKGPNDVQWLFGCWYAYKKSRDRRWKDFAEIFESCLLESYEAQDPAFCFELVRLCGGKLNPKPKRILSLREELLRALLKVNRSCDPTWSKVRALVEGKPKHRTHNEKVWARQRREFPFRDLPD